jgi:predicted secreted protein
LAPLALTVPRTIASFLVLAGAAVGLGIGLFRLTVAGAIAVYFVVWWTSLFAILPLGARGAEPAEAVPGADASAPALPRLAEKAIWTTLAADIVFLAVTGLLPLAGL